jgi:hypothetical protein
VFFIIVIATTLFGGNKNSHFQRNEHCISNFLAEKQANLAQLVITITAKVGTTSNQQSHESTHIKAIK